ncbi:tetratricopeptide repeat protein [Comamonas endophytica]|uniref:tetratricopeptide repeat protein n=1 Tax=Comamonas endophytica TaxID=2949090 RepID=UPI003605EE26
MPMLPDASDIRLLTQVGFLAAGRGDVPRALRIFNALALLRPGQAFSFVGLACALMNAARAPEAVQKLQAACLPPGPESDLVQAFQGLALQLAGRAGKAPTCCARSCCAPAMTPLPKVRGLPPACWAKTWAPQRCPRPHGLRLLDSGIAMEITALLAAARPEPLMGAGWRRRRIPLRRSASRP